MNRFFKKDEKEMIRVLSPRERKILAMRYGINLNDETDNLPTHSLEKVGQEFGVTRERIRQIEEKAIRKLLKVGIILDTKE